MRNRIKIFRKKINSTSGETIAETLVTMIILSLAVLMLAGAVVTSARVNKKADNTDTSFSTENEIVTPDNVTITDCSKAGTDAEISISVNFHETENGYKYYEVQ